MPCQTVSSSTYSVIPPVSVCVAGWLGVFYVGIHVSVHLQADCAFECLSVCLSVHLFVLSLYSSLEKHAAKCALSSPPEVARGAVRCIGKLTIRNMSMEKLFEVHVVHVTPVAAVGSLLYVLFSQMSTFMTFAFVKLQKLDTVVLKCPRVNLSQICHSLWCT